MRKMEGVGLLIFCKIQHRIFSLGVPCIPGFDIKLIAELLGILLFKPHRIMQAFLNCLNRLIFEHRNLVISKMNLGLVIVNAK